MRVVIDTNVIVSALIKKDGNPARIVQAALAGELTPVMDARTIAEAREVLARPKFASKLDAELVQYTLEALEDAGNVLDAVAPYQGPLPDDTDRPFIELALATGAVLVTGNLRDFPADAGIEVLMPAEAVRRLLDG